MSRGGQVNGRGLEIAISGAGVAGPALAHWLLRCGHRPTLVEVAPQLRSGGYIIDFWGIGYRVAQRMGIEAALLEAGYQVRALHSVDRGGRIRAALDTDVLKEVMAASFTSLPRGDLARAVFDTIEGRVETLFADSITAIDMYAEGMQVQFERAAARDFDLVIGADGLHSNVRRLVFGAQAQYEKYLGCRVAACVVDGYRPRDELVYVTHNVPGKQVARFALRGDRTLFLFVFRSARGEIDDDIRAHKAILRREFGAAGWECAHILDAVDRVDSLYFDVVSQIHMPHWSDRRTALIGDAAACISLLGGEGTGLALTEAYVLAGELQRAQGDHARAFAAYEARMRRFIKSKQAGAAGFVSFFAARTRLGIWLRDLGIKAMNKRWLVKLLAGRTLRDDFELPDYDM